VQSSGVTEGYDFSKYQESNWESGKVDLMKAGIVDPVKVTRLALENAVSIASTLVTAEAIIVEMPDEKKNMQMPDSGMSMM